jgi:hypothetical protein
LAPWSIRQELAVLDDRASRLSSGRVPFLGLLRQPWLQCPVTEILEYLPSKGRLTQRDFYLARIVGENFRLFLTHVHCFTLRQAAMIAETLFVYAHYSLPDFQMAKAVLLERLAVIERELQSYEVTAPPTFSIFHNSE